jgi:putative holliday junction resolvase
MGRILAIDFGAKRCGIAVTDEFQIIANALTTVSNNELLTFLKNYFSKEKVDEVIIGEPLDLKGNATHATPLVNAFIKKFESQFPEMKIVKVDERFTSKMASQAILMSGVKKEKRKDKSLIDQVSATILLQYYLELIKNKI